jgi:hypothetical protein
MTTLNCADCKFPGGCDFCKYNRPSDRITREEDDYRQHSILEDQKRRAAAKIVGESMNKRFISRAELIDLLC